MDSTEVTPAALVLRYSDSRRGTLTFVDEEVARTGLFDQDEGIIP